MVDDKPDLDAIAQRARTGRRMASKERTSLAMAYQEARSHITELERQVRELKAELEVMRVELQSWQSEPHA